MILTQALIETVTTVNLSFMKKTTLVQPLKEEEEEEEEEALPLFKKKEALEEAVHLSFKKTVTKG